MPKAVVAEAPAVVVVDAPVAITAFMADTVAAIAAFMADTVAAIAAFMADTVAAITAGMLATLEVYAKDLVRDHLSSVTYRRPFTMILASVLIIATILPVSITAVIPSLQSRERLPSPKRSPSIPQIYQPCCYSLGFAIPAWSRPIAPSLIPRSRGGISQLTRWAVPPRATRRR
jgi:hypothetical protein